MRSGWRSSRLIAEGHLLIEDVPGVGKTMLAKAIARSIDCTFRRIQFTPDLLPTDVTGVNVFNQEQRRLRVPARARSSPTSCSATRSTGPPPRRSRRCSSAMEERQVTVDGETHPLRHAVHGDRDPEPDRARGHLPAARGAARPLHAAARDRLPVGRTIEVEILATHGTGSSPLDDLGPVTDAPGVAEMIAQARGCTSRPRSAATSSTRGRDPPSRATSTSAPVRGPRSCSCAPRVPRRRRGNATTSIPDDVKALAVPVLAHRLIVRRTP